MGPNQNRGARLKCRRPRAITISNLSILKTGKAKAIRFSTLEIICKELHCKPGDILDFEEDYPDCQRVVLEENYRSTQKILDSANHLIDKNLNRKSKELWSSKGEGEPIYLYESRDEKDEAQFVVKEIADLKRQSVSLKDIVVFYRTHAQSRVLEDALRRNQLPYRIVGGVRFYDRREIKDLTSYLRILVNPQDDVSFKRILNDV